MRLHSALRRPEFECDLLVLLGPYDAVKDLPLAWSQLIQSSHSRARPDFLLHGEPVSCDRPVDRLEEFLGLDWLGKELSLIHI